MATSDVKVTPGSGKNVATYSFTGEDSETKELQRITINKSDGTEIGTTSNPVQVAVQSAGATGSAVPANAMQAGGSDGTSLRALKVDTDGTTQINITKLNGTVVSTTNPIPVQVAAAAGAGFTPYHYISAASTNATNIKASAGTIGVISLQNNSATIYYVKFYDKASAPTVGTDTPVHTLLVPANTSGAGNNEGLPDEGLAFANGISFAITAGIADSDTAAAAAATITVNLGYK